MSLSITKLARYLTLIALAAIPFSPVVNKVFILAAILSIVSSEHRQQLQQLPQYQLFYPTIMLIVVFILGTTYNDYTIAQNIHFTIREIYPLFSLLLLPLFTSAKWQQAALYTTLFSIVIICLIKIMNFYGLFFIKSKGPLAFSFYLACVTYMLIVWLFFAKKINVYGLALLAFLLYTLFYINGQRTGMLAFIVGLMMFCVMVFNWKISAAAIITILLVCFGIYNTSTIAKKRVNLLITEVSNFQQNPNTSIGIRLSQIKYAYAHFKAAPIIGHGSGYYSGIKSNNKQFIFPEPTLNNKNAVIENSLITMLLRYGLIGLFVFMLWIVAVLRASKQLAPREYTMVSGIVTIFLVACMCYPALSDNISKTAFFLLLTTIGLARPNIANPKTTLS